MGLTSWLEPVLLRSPDTSGPGGVCQSLASRFRSIRLNVDFDVKTNPNLDQVLAQMRYTQAESQLPPDIRNYGVTIRKSASSPPAQEQRRGRP